MDFDLQVAIARPSAAMTWLGKLCNQDGTQLLAIALLGEMEDQARPVAVRSGCHPAFPYKSNRSAISFTISAHKSLFL